MEKEVDKALQDCHSVREVGPQDCLSMRLRGAERDLQDCVSV